MHERSLVQSLLQQVQAVAREHPASRVRAVRVRVGEFSGVEPQLLASAFDELVQLTQICGAKLEMESVPLAALCDQCGYEFRIERFSFQCGNCGSSKLSLQGGEELLFESVTMEEYVQ